ncbi:hypothetical protein TBK1r_75370 [Stieleria magnilauensis]|uniref:Protein kinase domain-containing protein n=1 Tax=Stieleria magnilauensis TaxID=2527963 RepID=A0ABX5Y2L4_9BACT|nr:hypothetical protein TBK1r_75370 [Planctomycetes bacterium TBK1r]
MNQSDEKNPEELQNPKVGELLDEFLIAEELGSPVSAEELCKENSGLLTALQDAIARQRRFESLKEDLDSQLPLVYGSYEVVEVLGKGGCGTVFRCRHKHLQREAAVKVVVLSMAILSPKLTSFARLRLCESSVTTGLPPSLTVAFSTMGQALSAGWQWNTCLAAALTISCRIQTHQNSRSFH